MPDPEELITEVRELIAREVTAGFASEDEIRERALEVVSEETEPSDALLDTIDDLLGDAVESHSRVQEQWTALTDNDRLDAAFAELEASGIVCRQNWTCCQTCGLAEMGDEVKPTSRGYAFYHQQDTDAAVETGSLFLAYGACSDEKATQLEVANEIARTIKENGLRVEWEGSLEKRMLVKLEWKKRR
jgi:hypothetical protein